MQILKAIKELNDLFALSQFLHCDTQEEIDLFCKRVGINHFSDGSDDSVKVKIEINIQGKHDQLYFVVKDDSSAVDVIMALSFNNLHVDTMNRQAGFIPLYLQTDGRITLITDLYQDTHQTNLAAIAIKTLTIQMMHSELEDLRDTVAQRTGK